jgi:hypothetical protein
VGFCHACGHEVDGWQCPVHPDEPILHAPAPEVKAWIDADRAQQVARDERTFGILTAATGAGTVLLLAIATQVPLVAGAIVVYAALGVVFHVRLDLANDALRDEVARIEERLAPFRLRSGRPAGGLLVWLAWPVVLLMLAWRRMRR